MKKIAFIFCLSILISTSINSQTLTEEQKQLLIADLDSLDHVIKLNAITLITQEKVAEATVKIEQRLWNQDPILQYLFLRALWKLNSPNTLSFARAFFDSTNSFNSHGDDSEDPLKMKVWATQILFAYGDYSKTSAVFDLLNRDSTRIDFIARNLLISIIKHVPEYAQAAKAQLIRIALHANDSFSRMYSIIHVEDIYGSDISEMSDLLATVARNDQNPSIRFEALFQLVRVDPSLGHILLLERLNSEPASIYHTDIADTLLLKYGTPSDYKEVKTRQQLETDTLTKSLMWFSLRNFKPPKPDSLLTLSQLIDSLGSYVSQIKSYNWLGNQTFVIDLNSHIITAKNNYNAGSQIDCARQIKLFQQAVDKKYKDTVNVTPEFVTTEGWKFLYYNAQYILDRLPQIPLDGCNVKLINSAGTKLTGGTLQYYDGSWKDAVNNNDGTFFVNTTKTTLSLRMTYEYSTQTKSNVAVGNDTAVFKTVNAQIQLQNSSGILIDAGTVQYYAGAWRTLGTTTNGIATKDLLPANYSFRMTYAYASKDKQQDIGANAIVVFQTVNTAVQLQNSHGALIDQGTVQYYSGAWRSLGTTTNGTASKELLPNNYSFRMTYEYASKDKQQDLGVNPTVVFQTVNAQVQLKNSQGTLIDQGTVQYYSGAWRSLGTTTNGTASKELLPNNYSFRMTYEYASKDKQQDLSTNPTVVFQTVNAAVQLQNSQGTLIDQGTVQYYSGAWRNFGITTNGVANKELLPNNYSFRMTYAYASKDKQQDLSTNPIVVFQTVNAAVQLQNSQGNLIDQGTIQYYSGAWQTFGTTKNGVANKELLPNNYSFRMTYEYASKDKQQDLSTNPTVIFQTVNAAVQLQNSQGALIPAPSGDQGTVQYYSGAWRTFGNTTNGVANKELLPNNYSFRMTYEYASKDKQQYLNTNPTVVFQTVNAGVQLRNSQGSLMPAPSGDQGTVQYYSGAWRSFGTTTNGTASKELLPNNYSFRMTYEYVSIDKQQDLSNNNIVSFSTVLCTIRVRNSQDQLVENAFASYYSGAWRLIGKTVNGEITKELLPVNLSFRVKYDTQQLDKQQNLSTNNVVEFGIQ